MVYKFEGGIKLSKKVSKVKVNEAFKLLYSPEMKKHLRAHGHILINLGLDPPLSHPQPKVGRLFILSSTYCTVQSCAR